MKFTKQIANPDMMISPVRILNEDNLPEGPCLRYWRSCARRLYGKVDVVDPMRYFMSTLRATLPAGTKVYRASTGGKWGKSSKIVTL